MGERHLNPDAVRVIRESLGLRRVDLARRSGISAGHITRIETSQRHASPANMVRIAKALDVPLAAITFITAPTTIDLTAVAPATAPEPAETPDAAEAVA